MGKTYYIGLSVTYHDPAVAILDDAGEVLFAEATERYLQYKRALNAEPDNLYLIPTLLKTYCPSPNSVVVALNWKKKRSLYEQVVAGLGILDAAGLLRTGIKSLVAPLPNYKLHHMMACQRNSVAKAGLNVVRVLHELFPRSAIRLVDFDHHLTHAGSACYASPFEEAACAVVDSYGERGSLAFYHYRNGKLELHREARGLGSLGFYYMKLTELCGFDWLKGEEWKVMGLAAYGRLDEDIYPLLQSTLVVEGLSLKCHRRPLFEALAKLERRTRREGTVPGQAANLAYTGQYFFSELMGKLLNNFHSCGATDNLVLAGGCALNSSFNGQILEKTPFKQLYIPPAPADDGTALGAAWLAYFEDHPEARPKVEMLSPYLGSDVSRRTLQNLARFGKGLSVQHLPRRSTTETARLLAEGKLIGWIQGGAEFGPRALGNRSILADPRNAGVKDKINQLVKFREDYRPLAPSILHEFGEDFFLHYQESPYMERTLRFRQSAIHKVPAVVHVDGTGRLQTVKREWNPRFYDLILMFYRLTGVPLLVNTSFNIMGKPIAHSIEDMIGVFMTTGLDALVIEDYLFTKPDVHP
jgi:carbamoyltransferase